MVLADGRVDELGVLTHHRPKSAVPFGGFARVIDFALSNLLHSGIELKNRQRNRQRLKFTLRFKNDFFQSGFQKITHAPSILSG